MRWKHRGGSLQISGRDTSARVRADASSPDAGFQIFQGFSWLVTNTLSEPMSLRFFVESGFRNVWFSDFLPPNSQDRRVRLIIGSFRAFRECERRADGRRRRIRHELGGLSSLFRDPGGTWYCRLILVIYG